MTSGMPRLLLVGGGHGQLFVLEALAQGRLRGGAVVLVASHAGQLYSGMVPGLVEGRYALEEMTIDLRALARAAGAEFVEGTVTRIDSAARRVHLADGATLEYDVASIAIGGDLAGADIPGVRAHARFVKPIDRAVGLVPALEAAAQAAGPEPLQVVVVGAGASGIEIALATRTRLDRLGASRAIISLVDSTDILLRDRGLAAADAAERALRDGEVTVRLSTGIEEVGPAHIRITGGRAIPADLVIWCTGTEAPSLFRESGLPVDARGYLTVDEYLAVPGATGLYGAGDAISLHTVRRVPRAGVYAVHQGPVLANNLAAALGAPGAAPSRRYIPQAQSLALLNCGDGRAILSYSGVALTSGWAMRLKDWLDRRFVRRFTKLGA